MKKIKIDKTIGNIFYLYILRVIMYIFPLITMPYLVRVLGIGNYGIISFVQVVTNYFVLLINYGFNLSGPREVSQNRDNHNKLEKIFNNVLIVKLLILLISVPLIILLGIVIPILRDNLIIYSLISIALMTEVLFPVWFFQGIESMKTITWINIFTRILGLLLMLIFVKSESDTFLSLLITNVSTLLGGAIGFVIIKKKFKFAIRIPEFKDLKNEIIEGWNLFLAQGLTAIFSNSNVFLIGIFLSPAQVGAYSVAEKVMRIVASFVSPISNALYPVSAKLFKESREKALSYLKKYLVLGTLFFGLVTICLFIFSGNIIFVMTGDKNPVVILILRIICIIPLSIFVNNIYGTQIMLNNKMEKAFRNSLLISGGILPVLSISLSFFSPSYGAPIGLLISELTLTIIMVVYVELIKKQGYLRRD